MKTLLITVSFLVATSFVNHPDQTNKKFESYYDVQLISNQMVGTNYEWVWSVTNPDPGSGKDDGTLQDLSHWGLIAPCITQADLVGAAYSTDGVTWHSLAATIAVDPSQDCFTDPVIKFDHGIDGAEPTYFKLIVNKAFSAGYSSAVFKSGRWTGCYVGMIPGIACDGGTPPR